MPVVAAENDEDAVLMNHRHAVDIAGADSSVSLVLMNIVLWGTGVSIEPPYLFQGLGRCGTNDRWRKRFEGVADAVACPKEDQRTIINFRD